MRTVQMCITSSWDAWRLELPAPEEKKKKALGGSSYLQPSNNVGGLNALFSWQSVFDHVHFDGH